MNSLEEHLTFLAEASPEPKLRVFSEQSVQETPFTVDCEEKLHTLYTEDPVKNDIFTTDEKYYLLLENIRNEIEKMDKIHHIRVLKILKDYKSIKLNENKSGIFVNLSFLPREAIETLVKYIEYIKKQEEYILNAENQQKSFKNLLG